MSKILDRYATAVRSSNLASKPRTVYSDADVLGAAGIAGKATLGNGDPGAPLAMALARLFTGDNGAVQHLVALMSAMAWRKAQGERIKLRQGQADDLARAVLAWHRNGVCTTCGGHGYQLVPGTTTIGKKRCKACKGTGKIPFEKNFALEHVLLARWLLAEVEREMAKAGPAAMAALAPRLNL